MSGCHRIAALASQAVPAAEHVMTPRVGHMANLEDPALFNATGLDFQTRSSDK